MTPANIAGMAALKGLDVVALTDHNSSRNCPSFFKAAKEFGVLPIAGMEINTMEEVHALCLFPELEQALDFDSYVYQKLQKVENNPRFFGNQIEYADKDDYDAPSGTEKYLLINAVDISFDELDQLVNEHGGVMIPAHIDKTANSLIANLGFIPPTSTFKTAELKNMSKLHALRADNPYLNNCQIISDSDAHSLSDINEPNLTIPVKEKSAAAVIEYLRGKY